MYLLYHGRAVPYPPSALTHSGRLVGGRGRTSRLPYHSYIEAQYANENEEWFAMPLVRWPESG